MFVRVCRVNIKILKLLNKYAKGKKKLFKILYRVMSGKKKLVVAKNWTKPMVQFKIRKNDQFI